MSARILRTSSQPLRLATARLHARPLSTTPPNQPGSTKPTEDPSSKGSSSNTFWYLLLGTGAAVGGWYYMQQDQASSSHAVDHAKKRQEVEEEVKRKVQEAVDAGKQTAKGVVREGQEGYQDFKVSGKAKLDQARTEAATRGEAAEHKLSEVTAKAEQTYADVKKAAAGAYDGAIKKAEEEKRTWGQWAGSWFGYGGKKE